jgi:hypothetical protein
MVKIKPRTLFIKKNIQKKRYQYRGKIRPVKFKKKDFEFKHITVEIPNLEEGFENYKIINLSDLHLGQWLTSKHLKGIINLVNREKPDLLVLTGDYVSYLIDEVEKPLEDCFMGISSEIQTLAVLGNHDHWLGADKIKKILENANIRDISNDVFTITKKTGNKKSVLHIAGVDSYMLNKDRLDIVMKKLPDNGPAILLVHEPDFAKISSKTHRFALQISGHSHGGQIIIPGLKPIIRGSKSYKYPLGLYKVEDMIQYTNKGLGTNLFWTRINCKPEITIFTLKKKN